MNTDVMLRRNLSADPQKRVSKPIGEPLEGASFNRRLRLAFVSAADPLDVQTWSGTPLHMVEALRRHADVVEIVRRPWGRQFDLVRRAVRRLTKWRYDLYWSPLLSRLGCMHTVRRLRNLNCDAVVSVANAPIAARLGPLMPTAYVSDATVSAMSDYNRKFQLLNADLKQSAEALERTAIETSILTAYPSSWALESALNDYGASPHKTLLIHWGANMEPSDGAASAARPERPFRLLFVGVDWVWKGGDILLRTFQGLRSRGYDVELDVVGSSPGDPPPTIPGVTFHGFISKTSQDGRNRIEALFRRAHLLIFPTQFEALGIVSAESAAFGVPVVAYRTGGVPANIKDGETGVLIEEGASPEEFVEAVAALIEDPERRQRMGESAIEFSQEDLNWDAWAKNLIAAIRTALINASANEPRA